MTDSPVMTTTKPAEPSASKNTKKNPLSDGQGALAGLLISPTMLVIALVVGFPILFSLRESLFRGSSGVDPNTGIVQSGDQFVGLANFTDIFTNPQTIIGVWGSMDRLINAFLNTTFFTVVCVAAETIIGVAMAIIMSKAFRGRGLVRAAILVPWAIPTIVSAKMWALIFDANGVANKLLGQNILWLADNSYSQWAVIVADVWKTAPFIGLLTLAGLQTIPDEVYEAARVDGATTWQTFWKLIFPLLAPMSATVGIFAFLYAWNDFMMPSLIISDPAMQTLPVRQNLFQNQFSNNYNVSFASYLMAMAPAIVAYLFTQRWVMEGVTQGAVKG